MAFYFATATNKCFHSRAAQDADSPLASRQMSDYTREKENPYAQN